MKSLDYSKEIIRYFKFQRKFINKDLIKALDLYINNKNEFDHFTNKEIITNDTKNLIDLFSSISKLYSINYLNYVLIIETLTKQEIRNIYRYFSFKWNLLLNKDEISNKEDLKLKYNYLEFIKFSNAKEKLIEVLQDLKLKNDTSLIYFIGCLKNLFT